MDMERGFCKHHIPLTESCSLCNETYDREFNGKPSPWIPSETDVSANESEPKPEPHCPECGAPERMLAFRLNDTTECQQCGYRSDHSAFGFKPYEEPEEPSDDEEHYANQLAAHIILWHRCQNLGKSDEVHGHLHVASNPDAWDV